MKRIWCVSLLITSLALPALPVLADSYSDTIALFKNAGASAAYFASSYGYAVFPTIGKGGLGIGGAHGTGHVYKNSEYIGDTSMTQVSIGLQAGGQSTDLVLVGVNRRSMDDLLKDKVKLGGDIAAAAGPVGRDSQASTTELANAEFLTYSRSKGLFAGVDLTGDEIHQNGDDTRAYYGKDISYKTILSGVVPAPPSAHHFVATVNEMFRAGRAHANVASK